MNPQQLTQMYEEATGMAEAGRYEQALSKMLEYLRHRPQDGQAFNDAATILFCLGRGRDAIAFYEKAAQFCQGDQLAQVYWNLCEAYLQENQPARAIALFDDLETMGLLSIDLLNRTADALLRQDLLGPAVELLLRSLQISPDQEILVPMLDVIRSHRARISVVVSSMSALAHSAADGLRQRLIVTVVDDQPQLPVQTDVALFFGCGHCLVNTSMQSSEMRRVAILDAQDILSSRIREVNWRNVQTVILCGGRDMAELLAEQIGTLPTGLRLIHAEPIPNPECVVFTSRKKGKRIAAIGPWDARRNPMFALMCFQKLNFLDPDTRLHIAGEFSDALTERYVRQIIETLGLDNVVFLDGPVKDIRKWLKDKHFVLSTAIDGSGLEDVWMAMACGLRPLVHTFPGAAERLDSPYLFTLAEDFCERILHGHYDAAEHRAAVERGYMQMGLEQIINDLIFKFEKELPLKNRSQLAAAAPVARTVQPFVSCSSLTPDAQPSWTNAASQVSPAFSAPAAGPTPTPARSVRQIASDALAATQKLQDLAAGRGQPLDLSPSGSPADSKNTPQNDTFKYNCIDGLSVEELTGEGRGSVPFAGRR